ncbi:Cof-type HAD-IIB family hydrolase [Enterococcus columbae]|uniref:HAD superfamily hydrolase n=1 Tax=Enterococcus columbae DSM 7374 = ATCC 51263 TaxID=1121865 RepID=S0KJB5_9ENTE|nr:Cof-type HAD-IIB family hydrolase [Enterococcus columbae]EOT44879.1 hypothetical protein OMW_00065 [Enterococcus columbae DSM 7374 = ATCC 51263]EOW84172.1 hypothetical protein I568_00659 [Enterococcus columbae DSM 7374 = ATCC 51263]OJG24922.1 hypothetical protein RR47_GL002016 [Enterococcus columbae DSM 7374 = ATCC 51263]
MIQMIASDMDGTLLDEHMQISEENIQAIRYAQDKGIQFMVCTGRNITEVLPALSDANITCPMITLNGAQAFDQNKNVLFTAGIEQELALAIIEILEQEHIYYEISTNEGTFSQDLARRIETFAAFLCERMPHLTYQMAIAMTSARFDQLPIKIVPNLKAYINQPQVQVLKIIGFEHKRPEILAKVRQKLQDFNELAVTSSGSNNIEINHKMAQKGLAVKQMAELLQIPLTQVMTIGDNLNDLSMIQMAGVSFAMENAIDDLKAAAKYQTDTNVNSGVGKAIFRAIDEKLT